MLSSIAMPPTIADLLASLDIVDDDVTAIVEAYMANRRLRSAALGEGYRLNPAAAVAAHSFAASMIRQRWATPELKRAAVRAAIMLAVPERGGNPRRGSRRPTKR